MTTAESTRRTAPGRRHSGRSSRIAVAAVAAAAVVVAMVMAVLPGAAAEAAFLTNKATTGLMASSRRKSGIEANRCWQRCRLQQHQQPQRRWRQRHSDRILIGSSSNDVAEAAAEADSAIQWELFKKHHARGSYKGIWTTYDYIGDVLDETIGAVDLILEEGSDVVQHSHQVVVGAKRSDCATCFDSMEVKTLPIATLQGPDDLLLRAKTRCAASGMVAGPRVLRSGAMATELVLSHGDGRIRVMVRARRCDATGEGTSPLLSCLSLQLG